MNLPLPDALVLLGQWLRAAGYQFTTGTPDTHARVNARPGSREAHDLRGVFGWSRPFAPALLPAQALGWLREAGLAEEQGALLRSRVRFSSLGGQLYAHSSWPTGDADSVFFGPDTYRFAALIEDELRRAPLDTGTRILDIGCGAGPGGVLAALAASEAAPRLVLADINPGALDFARANARLAGLAGVEFAQGDLFHAVQGSFGLVVSNPPYLVDATARTYRHGGGALGSGLSERIVAEGLPRLAPGGRLVLYTGVAMVEGVDPFLEAMRPLLERTAWPWHYRELDPDVFGEELEREAYAHADRIAAVALVVRRPAD
ncbi:MAG: methyltransferase [Burkholderiales bacterium]|nr:methyltransferase [Burkholderiales bacterium]